MSSSLSGIPAQKRRQAAATLGLFAALFVAVGLVALTGSAPGVVQVFATISLVLALVLALLAWGVLSGLRAELRELQLDQAIDEALSAGGNRGQLCDCGHDHDPDELHITDNPCQHDGAGTDCTHSCDTCVLAAMRPSPSQSRADRLR